MNAVLAPVRRMIGNSGVAAATVAILALLLLVGTRSPLAGGVAVGLAAITLIVVCFDLARAGTFFITVAMLLAPLNDLRIGASYVTASDLVFVLGIGVLTPTILKNRIAPPPMLLLGLAILLTMGAVASVASPIPVVSANQVARLMVGAFALPLFFLVWRPPAATVARFGCAYIFGTVFSVFWGLMQGPVEGDARYIGFTYHPNYLGLSCLLAVSLTPYVTAVIAPQYRWILWGSSVISAYGVWISGSRAALVVLIMLAVVYPFVERSIKAVGAVLLGVAGVLAFSGRLLQEDGNSALGRLFGSGSASGSDTERKQVLSEAWAQFKHHPLLGNGFDGGLGSHNIYLQVAVAVGIFGLLGYLFIMWTAIRPLFWPVTSHRLAYPVLAYMAIGPLTNTLWDRLIWAVLALTFAVNLRPPRQDEVEAPPGALIKEGT